MRGRCFVLVWAATLACQSAPVAKTVRAPTTVVTPSATPTSVALPEVVKPETASVTAELSLERELACDAQVFALGSHRFVACGAELSLVEEAHAPAKNTLLARGLRLDAPGIAPPRIVAMAGRWPDAAWAATTEVSGNGNSSKLRFFRWRKERWVASGNSVELGGAMSGVVFPWREGMVALAPTAFGPTRVLTVGERSTTVPALSLAVQSTADRDSYPCQHALIAPEAFIELSSGDVMVFAGQLCGVPTTGREGELQARHLGVERLRFGEKSGQITLLPLPTGSPADAIWNVDGAAALSATDVLVAARGSGGYFSLARWNGQDWRQEPAPFATLSGLWAQAGAFWATDSFGTTWTRRSERWLRVDWRAPAAQSARDADEGPRRNEVSQIIAIDAKTTWLVRREERGPNVTSRIYRLRIEP